MDLVHEKKCSCPVCTDWSCEYSGSKDSLMDTNAESYSNECYCKDCCYYKECSRAEKDTD